MPQMSTIVSGVASVGLLAGVVSGLFYLLLTGIRWAGRVRAALQDDEQRRKASARCVSCGRTFNASSDSPVVCSVCGQRACFDLPCSRPASVGWTCIVCHVKRTTEAADATNDSSQNGTARRRSNANGGVGLDRDTIQVREFIEKIVQNIIGCALDGVPVGKLSHHHAYSEIFEKYHQELCHALGQLVYSLRFSISNASEPTPEMASSAHSALNNLIEKIAEEASMMPNLSQPSAQPHIPSRTSPLQDKSYEDILSTAILNQIITRYQRRHSSTERRDSNSNFLNKQSFRQDAIDDPDSDWSDVSNHRQDPFNIKVEEHIEEVTTAYGSSSEEADPEDLENLEDPLSSRRVPFPEFGVDIVDGEAVEDDQSDNESGSTDVMSNPSTWEENWLFQKKKPKMRNGHNPVPVPMLVPNPSQDFRALIGGVDADDISDLSECSDSVLEEVMSDIVDSQKEGQQIVDVLNDESFIYEREDMDTEFNTRSEDTSTAASKVSEERTEEDRPSSAETHLSSPPESLEKGDDPSGKSAQLEDGEMAALTDAQPISIGERDRDVPVEFETALQINRPPVPRPRTLELGASNDPGAEEEKDEVAEEENKPIICPIAEREKAKWNNPVEMKNNPYTPENIAKRSLSRSMIHLNGPGSTDSVEFSEEPTVEPASPPQRKYSRDYYVKASRSPTGEPPSRLTDSPLSFRSETSLENDNAPSEPQRIEVLDSVTKSAEKLEEETPKVEEIRKNFLATKPPPIPNRSKSLPRQKSSLEEEFTPKPVSEIIEELANSAHKAEPRRNSEERQYEEGETVRRVSLWDTKNNSSQSEASERAGMLSNARKPVKPVHSLTARSIPKDFREGLKIKSKNSKPEHVADVYSADDEEDSLLLLNFDVQGKKKFWENIAKMN